METTLLQIMPIKDMFFKKIPLNKALKKNRNNPYTFKAFCKGLNKPFAVNKAFRKIATSLYKNSLGN